MCPFVCLSTGPEQTWFRPVTLRDWTFVHVEHENYGPVKWGTAPVYRYPSVRREPFPVPQALHASTPRSYVAPDGYLYWHKTLVATQWLSSMALQFDREKLLYAVGIALGVAAVAYFGFQLFDQVSPATTAALLFGGFLCFLVAGVGIDLETLDIVAYALAAGSYLVFVAYVLSRFDVGDGGTFLLLAASSGLFVALGYLAQQGRLTLERRQALIVILVVVVAAVALVGVDLVGAQPTTSVDVEESVEIPDRHEVVTVGTVTVENEFFLPRRTDVQRYHACVYGPEFRPAPIEFEPRAGSTLLGGGETRRFDLRLPGQAFYDRNGTLQPGFQGRDSVPVETASECPENSQDPKVVVIPRPLPRGV